MTATFDHTLDRYRATKYYKNRGKYPKPPTHNQLYKMCLGLEQEFQTKFPKHYAYYQANGKLPEKMPKRLFNHISAVGSALENHFEADHTTLFGKIDYISLSMLKYVYDRDWQEDIVGKLLVHATSKTALTKPDGTPF